MQSKRGLLLVNLGTPSQATPKAIKRYLGEFLRDRHVVDINPLIWLPILYGIVLPKRIGYISKHYQSIWLNNKSPLLYYCEQLCEKVQLNHPDLNCQLAMNYGEPSLESTLLKMQDCQQIDVLCLYPQYSTTTTQAVIDKINHIIRSWRDFPDINFLPDYADNSIYIEALFKQITMYIEQHQPPDVLLLSYHGIPISYINKRQEPYVERCQLTSTLLIKKLQVYYPNMAVQITYQSRFGKGEWTTPNTSDVLEALAKQQKSVAVICPGFAVDCLETLYEIAEENYQLFTTAGGKQFSYIPALNDSDLHLKLIENLITFC